MLSWNNLLEEINQLFVKTTRDKIFNGEVENFSEHVRACLKLNKIEDWNYILASEDILEDSNLAIESFLKFGLGGPTKYKDTGEKYLRLYGVLNAAYLQQQSIFTLYKLFQCPKPNNIKLKIESLEIRGLRHKLGAHSTDFSDNVSGEIYSYVPVRMMLEDFKCDYFNHTTDTYCEVNLKEIIESHLKLMCSIYYDILIKSVKTIYKSNPSKINSLNESAEPFKAMISGSGIIKDALSGKYLIINFV